MPLTKIICPSGREVSLTRCLLCKNDTWCGTKEWRRKFLFAQGKLEKDIDRGKYSASILSYLDPAKIVFSYKFPYALSINLIHIFIMGHAIHQLYESAYPPESCEVPVETELTPGIKISGHVDIFYKNKIYDLKTVSTFARQPKWYYKNQLSIYGTILEDYYSEKVDEMYLWFVNKSTGENKLYKISLDKEIFEEAKEVALTSYKAIKESRKFQIKLNDQCASCPVRKYCEAYRDDLMEVNGNE